MHNNNNENIKPIIWIFVAVTLITGYLVLIPMGASIKSTSISEKRIDALEKKMDSIAYKQDMKELDDDINETLDKMVTKEEFNKSMNELKVLIKSKQ